MLEISEDEYNSLWAELQWPGEKFERVMNYFRKYAGLEEGLSSKGLTRLLIDLGKNCYTVRGGLESLTKRGDLCWIISGTDIMSGSQFMCLAGLMDNSTPHSTNNPAGLLRLEMIFMYYDKGNKGYWDKSDWELIMRDIQYPSKNGEKLVPYPLKPDQIIDFEMLKKLVETRRLRGTSQLLRISFDEVNIENNNSKVNLDPNIMGALDINNSNNNLNYSPNSKKVLRVFSPKKKRQQKVQEPFKSESTGITFNMSKIPDIKQAIPNSPNQNNSPRIMTYRPEVTPNPYLMVNNMYKGEKMLNGKNQLNNASFVALSHNYQTPVQLIPAQVPINTQSYVNQNILGGNISHSFVSPMVQNRIGTSDNSNILNLNSLQNLGQSLQNIGQSLISMIPKVFAVPNITVSAGNYTYASQIDLQNRLNDSDISLSIDKSHNDTSDSNNIHSKNKVLAENIISSSLENDYNRLSFSNISLPNFHSTYSNDNYPMSIDLTKFKEDSTLLPTIPEISSKLNSYGIANYNNELNSIKEVIKDSDCINNIDVSGYNEIKISRDDCFNKNANGNNSCDNNNKDNGIKQSFPVKIEEIDYFFTFMEQLLYNEIIENKSVLNKLMENYNINFELSDKEFKYFGKIMTISTMDQLLLTFALNCIISHQNDNINQLQDKGVVGNGVTLEEINDGIDKILDTFGRIYRIMYQDLKNEMERNLTEDSDETQSDFTMYNNLPYVIKMVWEKIKTALKDDSDKEETIKDICFVYYHYILETNELFNVKSCDDNSKIRYHSIDEMIEIVRQRYVVAMKMLSLNNLAKNNKLIKEKTVNNSSIENISISDYKTERVKIKYNESSYENISCNSPNKHENGGKILGSSSSPKYPLLTATSSPNYKQGGFNSLGMVCGGIRTTKLEHDISKRLENDSYSLQNYLVPSLSSENLCVDMNTTNSGPRNKSDSYKYNNMIYDKTNVGEIQSSSRRYSNFMNSKVQANIASYCPTEHVLTDKIPDTRLERKSRIPSRIL